MRSRPSAFAFPRLALPLLALAGCTGDTGELVDYVLSQDSFELGVASRLDGSYASDSLSLLNLRNDELRVTLIGITGTGAEMVDAADTTDFTALASEAALELSVAMVNDRAEWATGAWSPALVVQLGRVVDVSSDWDDPESWTQTEIEIPIHVEVDCDIDGDGADDVTCSGDDCDDLDATAALGLPEICDGADNDCDGSVDVGANDVVHQYADGDGDGYGNPVYELDACDLRSGYVEDATDCDDADATAYPGATEVCDEADNNCDGAVDEGLALPYYADADGDTFGDPAATTDACAAPTGYVEDATDCADADAGRNPAAVETDDERDEDCDEWVDEGFVAVGDVVITELMVDADLGAGSLQWFEVTALATSVLDGWEVVSGSSAFFVSPDAGLALAPGEIVVFCQDADALAATAPSVPCDYEYATADNGYADSAWGADQVEALALATEGSLRLEVDGVTIDSVTWDASWPIADSASLSLDPGFTDASANDDDGAWCAETAAYTTDGLVYGSPGSANAGCAPWSRGDSPPPTRPEYIPAMLLLAACTAPGPASDDRHGRDDSARADSVGADSAADDTASTQETGTPDTGGTAAIPEGLAGLDRLGFRHILVVHVDTLRADVLPFYAYERETTPRMSEREWMVVDGVVAASSWTLPSTASILTGRDVQHHGIAHLDASRAAPDMPSDTLAQHFTDAGFRTFFYSGNGALRATVGGYSTGFETANPAWSGEVQRDMAEIGAATLDWIDGLDPDDRFFAFLQPMDPHGPYDPQSPWLGTWSDPSALPFSLESTSEEQVEEVRDAWNAASGDSEAQDAVIQAVRDVYDETVLELDDGVGALLDGLADRGLTEDTLVVLASDHGETFYDDPSLHSIGHGNTVRTELVHVPLAFLHPRLPVQPTVECRAQNYDIGATLLRAAGVPPMDDVQGVALQDGCREQLVASTFLGERDATQPLELLATDGRYALRWDCLLDRVLRYDHATDPGEAAALDADELPLPELDAALRTFHDDLQATLGSEACAAAD